MERPRIALVCRNPLQRVAAAAAFDSAPAEWDVTLHVEPPEDADVVVAVGDAEGGDLDLDPERPGDVVARVAALLSAASARVVAVVGASGGCGATSLVLHLAAQSRSRTCVVDLQQPTGCAPRVGLARDDLVDPRLPVPVAGGFALTWTDAATAPGLVQGLRRDHGAVFVDCPSSLLGSVIEGCDAIVVVVTPTVGSAGRASELLELVGDVPAGVVANRLGPGGETTRVELQRILGRRVTLELPCSPGLRDSEDDARLMTSPWSPWLRRVARLSAALTS